MGEVVVVAVWKRIKVLPSSLYSARHQSAQFQFVAVFVVLMITKNIKPLCELEKS